MKNILVVGGAGYIGSHMVLTLLENGYNPITYDNLSEGHRESVLGGVFIKGDIADSKKLKEVFNSYDISAVMHFAAHCYVGESVKDPQKYYQNNVLNTFNLLKEMLNAKIDKFIFSSTCAVYGNPQYLPLTEEHVFNPINPYGNTKLTIERMLSDYDKAYNLRSIRPRYFNAAGADPLSRIGENHSPETHLIPNVINTALGINDVLEVFGDDYETPDGTCIRDYIHILDIAQAHLLALEKLLNGYGSDVFNLGNNKGYSVKEVIDMVEKLSGKSVNVKIVPRRAGDPPILVGSSEKAQNILGWKQKFFDLETIVKTALDWHIKLKEVKNEKN